MQEGIQDINIAEFLGNRYHIGQNPTFVEEASWVVAGGENGKKRSYSKMRTLIRRQFKGLVYKATEKKYHKNAGTLFKNTGNTTYCIKT